MTPEPAPAKICAICGEDCAGRPRTKDPKGRYYCQACYDERRREVAASRAAPAAPAPAVALDVDPDMLAEILDTASEPVPQAEALPTVWSATCPGCGGPLDPGAVICTRCGYDVHKGKQLKVRKVKAKGKGGGRPRSAAFVLSPGGVGLILLLLFGLLYWLAWHDDLGALVYAAIAGTFGFVVVIMVLVFAFRESIGQGFLTLCVPCYVLYFVYGICDNAWIKVLFAVYLITNAALQVLTMMSPVFQELNAYP